MVYSRATLVDCIMAMTMAGGSPPLPVPPVSVSVRTRRGSQHALCHRQRRRQVDVELGPGPLPCWLRRVRSGGRCHGGGLRRPRKRLAAVQRVVEVRMSCMSWFAGGQSEAVGSQAISRRQLITGELITGGCCQATGSAVCCLRSIEEARVRDLSLGSPDAAPGHKPEPVRLARTPGLLISEARDWEQYFRDKH